MTVFDPNPCYNKVCYKGNALYVVTMVFVIIIYAVWAEC